ncbi:MAG: hypothetical protein ACRDQ5_07105 [Sciscionella sp.]
MSLSGESRRDPAGESREYPGNERGELIDELSRNPRPAVSRAALAARYPGWGLVTMSLLVVGLVVGFLSFGPLGAAINACGAQPDLPICVPSMHATAVALPVGAMIVGLAVSLVGGRLVAKLGRSPIAAGWLGWLGYAVGVVLAYHLAGLL